MNPIKGRFVLCLVAFAFSISFAAPPPPPPPPPPAAVPADTVAVPPPPPAAAPADTVAAAPADSVATTADTVAVPPPPPVAAPADTVAAAPEKKCETTQYNINEISSKISSGFPASLKDCSVTLAKEIAMAKSPFAKKPAPEPKSFMTSCAIDGVKAKLPAGADEYIKPVEGFLQNIMNAASAGGSLDVSKLSGAIGSMNPNDLVNEIKTKAANDPCAVDLPYTAVAEADSKGEDSGEKKGRRIVHFGLRGGINFSNLSVDYKGVYGSRSGHYNSVFGFQGGLNLDIAPTAWFHIQPNLMFIRKGYDDSRGKIALDYIELPLLFSLKFSVVRINAGPYVAVLPDSPSYNYDRWSSDPAFNFIDWGMSYGLGFDLWIFYIGAFYDYGLYDVSNRNGFSFYNRTLGFNLGVNL